jgi:hypothetical protein
MSAHVIISQVTCSGRQTGSELAIRLWAPLTTLGPDRHLFWLVPDISPVVLQSPRFWKNSTIQRSRYILPDSYQDYALCTSLSWALPICSEHELTTR